jgi:hypothetical protein
MDRLWGVPSGAPVGFLDIEIVGNQRGVEAMLETIDSALSPVGLAAFLYGSVGPWVKQRAEDRFKAEGDDVTGKWAPLMPATQEIRESYGFGGSHPINKRIGELEDYITQGQISVVTTPGLGVLKFPGNPPATASLKEKLSTAQKGRAAPKTVPRPVLGLNEKDLTAVMTMLAFHIQHEGRLLGVTP